MGRMVHWAFRSMRSTIVLAGRGSVHVFEGWSYLTGSHDGEGEFVLDSIATASTPSPNISGFLSSVLAVPNQVFCNYAKFRLSRCYVVLTSGSLHRAKGLDRCLL